ncbi:MULTISPECIES: 4Fe-4S binding protein [Ferrimonas]|uniref:4Fe-4S binding protein n=1 Tax=Ferrimonas TaxID=44011 RepID=UPI000408E670|nr:MULTISPECIES: 4Fe-4S binding protein [Ferrimonas]USD36395.1 4Fe-4S binding protein [Ferrimonas sp. SCSIO 43195]
MTVIESITLMFGLVFSLSLLYWSNQKWGLLLTAALMVTALALTLYWPLLLGAAVAMLALVALHHWRPEIARGQGRENGLRDWVHHSMSLAMVLVGIQYVLYYSLLGQGVETGLGRPDVVDAFLPIAGGIELKAIIMLNLWDQNHPAAAVMLTSVLLSGLICKRAFCGWICPLGLAGKYLYDLRVRFIKGAYLAPKWLDWPLRMLKYLLLLGLFYIVIGMPAESLPYYLDGNYQKIADLKMGLFFANPSVLALVVIAVILGLAAWQQQAFCRYLCPYGALLGLLSFLSPFKVRRDTNHCLIQSRGMKCDKCTRACPARIQVHTESTVRSDECQACMRCVAACPKKEALQVSTRWGQTLSARGVLIILLLLMFAVPLVAYVGGFWHSQVSDATRIELMKYIHQIGH